MNGLFKHKWELVIGFLTSFFVIRAIYSDGVFEGGDNYSHYFIARYGYQYPNLLLDHWGKPFFTLVSSPFAVFGFKAMKCFNVLAGMFAVYYSYRICIKLKINNPGFVILFICFAPIYYQLLNSTLTEVLFSSLLVLSIYLFINNRYFFSALVLSLIPFVRNEMVFLMPCFALAFILRKQYLSVILLSTGFLLYSLIGGVYYGDFLWLFHLNPYQASANIYGHGDLFHFFRNLKFITGSILTLLLAIGVIRQVWELFENKTEKKIEFLLIFLPMIFYFLFHVFMWWKGLGGSLGLIRVVTAIIPLIAISGLKGYNYLLSVSHFRYKFIMGSSFVMLFVFLTLNNCRLLTPYDDSQIVVVRAANWIKKNGYANRKVFSMDPLTFLILNKDPYNVNTADFYLPEDKFVAKNSIVVWDAHLSALEGRIPLKRMMENYKFLALFKPKVPFKVLGGLNYEVYVFENRN